MGRTILDTEHHCLILAPTRIDGEKCLHLKGPGCQKYSALVKSCLVDTE